MRNKKEAYELFWMIKGRIIPDSWSDEDIEKMYYDYFKRCWYNEESYIYRKGFEEAYINYITKKE